MPVQKPSSDDDDDVTPAQRALEFVTALGDQDAIAALTAPVTLYVEGTGSGKPRRTTRRHRENTCHVRGEFTTIKAPRQVFEAVTDLPPSAWCDMCWDTDYGYRFSGFAGVSAADIVGVAALADAFDTTLQAADRRHAVGVVWSLTHSSELVCRLADDLREGLIEIVGDLDPLLVAAYTIRPPDDLRLLKLLPPDALRTGRESDLVALAPHRNIDLAVRAGARTLDELFAAFHPKKHANDATLGALPKAPPRFTPSSFRTVRAWASAEWVAAVSDVWADITVTFRDAAVAAASAVSGVGLILVEKHEVARSVHPFAPWWHQLTIIPTDHYALVVGDPLLLSAFFGVKCRKIGTPATSKSEQILVVGEDSHPDLQQVANTAVALAEEADADVEDTAYLETAFLLAQ
jgi:hypothetical protein